MDEDTKRKTKAQYFKKLVYHNCHKLTAAVLLYEKYSEGEHDYDISDMMPTLLKLAGFFNTEDSPYEIEPYDPELHTRFNFLPSIDELGDCLNMLDTDTLLALSYELCCQSLCLFDSYTVHSGKNRIHPDICATASSIMEAVDHIADMMGIDQYNLHDDHLLHTENDLKGALGNFNAWVKENGHEPDAPDVAIMNSYLLFALESIQKFENWEDGLHYADEAEQ